MDLSNYLDIIKRRWWVIVGTVLFTLLVVGVGQRTITPLYSATATLRLKTASSGTLDSLRFDLSYTDRLMNTYINLATSAPVLGELAQQLEMELPPKVRAEITTNTELIRITVEDTDAALAAKAANTLAQILIDDFKTSNSSAIETAPTILNEQLAQAKEELDNSLKEYASIAILHGMDSDRVVIAGRQLEAKQSIYLTLLRQYEELRAMEIVRQSLMSLVEPASVPETSSNLHPVIFYLTGFVFGLVGGLGLAFLFERLDERLYEVNDVERVTRLPVIGSTPRTKRQVKIPFFNPGSGQAEAIQRLWTYVYNRNAESPLGSLVVASSEPREGRSTLAANLASLVALTEKRVLIIDADWQKPVLHEVFNLPNETGLSDLVQGKSKPEQVVQKSSMPGLNILTSGPIPADHLVIFNSSWIAPLLEKLSSQYDLVIIDTPPILASMEASIFAAAVDSTILIAVPARTHRKALKESLTQLERMKARIEGVFLNRVH